MIKNIKRTFFSALKILSDERNLPAMINCAHGKDRTGIVSAMVLGVLGKTNTEIAENYALSQVSDIDLFFSRGFLTGFYTV